MTFIKIYLAVLLFFQFLTVVGNCSQSTRVIAAIFSISTAYTLLVLWGVL